MDYKYYEAHREIADFYGELVNLLGTEEGFEWLSRAFESLDMDPEPYTGSLKSRAYRLFKRHADVDLRTIMESLGTLGDTRCRVFYLSMGQVVQLPWGPVNDRMLGRSTYMKGIVANITDEVVTVIIIPEQTVTDPVLDRSFKIHYDHKEDQARISPAMSSQMDGNDRHSMWGALRITHLPRSEEYVYGLESAPLTQDGDFRPGGLYVKSEEAAGTLRSDVVIPVRVCSPPPDGLRYVFEEECRYLFFKGFGGHLTYDMFDHNGWRELSGPPRS